MTGGVEVPGGIQRVSGIPGVEDPVGLAKWMAGVGLADVGELRGVQLIAGGRSNLTYRLAVEGPSGRRLLVLRRPPLGHVLPTAHDMSREFRVHSALAGTRVPVARATTGATWMSVRNPAVTACQNVVRSLGDGCNERANIGRYAILLEQ